MKNILLTGGCGFKGTVLIEKLLKDGHEILNLDNRWFGNYLDDHPRLKNIKCDIRDMKLDYFDGVERIIHLANIANDPAVDLNPNLEPCAAHNTLFGPGEKHIGIMNANVATRSS